MDVNVVTLFRCVASDVALDPLTTRYCITRLKSEGLKFWTVTLPKLSRTVLRSLELGYFARTKSQGNDFDLTDFAWKGQSLRFFRSFLNEIFDAGTGRVLDDPCPVALLQLRQLCEYAYKLTLDFDDSLIKESEQKFINLDNELAGLHFDDRWIESLRKDFETHYKAISTSVITDVFSKDRCRPGPGTFSAKRQYERFTGNPWYTRKETDYRTPPKYKGLGGLTKPYPGAPTQGSVEDDPFYSEVLFVPKDSRGPRVIVREPYSQLYHQMSFNGWISRMLEQCTSNRINFRDQQINRDLAHRASITKEFATLDLKDASDRVSAFIVQKIFRNSPACRYFTSRRTRITKLPSGNFKALNKLSGMGSGLTFPVMSLLISLSICRGVKNATGLRYRDIRSRVYVYGDDIILPTEWALVAKASLEKSGLQVNTSKSFSHSHFRESCGGDYLYGNDVTPVRLRLSQSENSSSGACLSINGEFLLLGVERHCRELRKAMLDQTAEFWYRRLETDFGPLPLISGETSVIGRWSITPVSYDTDERGEHKLVRVIVPIARELEFNQDPYIHLSKFLYRDTGPRWDRFLEPVEGSTYGSVSVPRSIRYIRRKISGFALMG